MYFKTTSSQTYGVRIYAVLFQVRIKIQVSYTLDLVTLLETKLNDELMTNTL